MPEKYRSLSTTSKGMRVKSETGAKKANATSDEARVQTEVQNSPLASSPSDLDQQAARRLGSFPAPRRRLSKSGDVDKHSVSAQKIAEQAKQDSSSETSSVNSTDSSVSTLTDEYSESADSPADDHWENSLGVETVFAKDESFLASDKAKSTEGLMQGFPEEKLKASSRTTCETRMSSLQSMISSDSSTTNNIGTTKSGTTSFLAFLDAKVYEKPKQFVRMSICICDEDKDVDTKKTKTGHCAEISADISEGSRAPVRRQNSSSRSFRKFLHNQQADNSDGVRPTLQGQDSSSFRKFLQKQKADNSNGARPTVQRQDSSSFRKFLQKQKAHNSEGPRPTVQRQDSSGFLKFLEQQQHAEISTSDASEGLRPIIQRQDSSGFLKYVQKQQICITSETTPG